MCPSVRRKLEAVMFKAILTPILLGLAVALVIRATVPGRTY